ncbi:DivIVA domain-containing protein [Micromonospora pallida]|uniref:DivIVA domain-containing protein n=1 Tax=Micromonospora pallida TaxID=145854 RepID=A0A1C6RPX6_9ACTN|nr:DivIVA domain-containing protein [Micromonospora pallida]SCL19211.1 DivIVA domain-containing protein [Micromonospora pallida]
MAQVYRGGRLYDGGLPDRLTPHEVRTRAFSPRRRGVDAGEVRKFQSEVADELADLHRQVRLLSEENARLTRALRDWQTMHARECRPNRGHW